MSELTFERLEQRQLLAGNVTAVMKGSTLVITGDADDNGVTVTDNGGGNFTVFGGVIDPLDTTTTINGVEEGVVSLTGVSKISVNLGDGNDALFMRQGSGLTSLASVTVKMGDGDDFFGGQLNFGLRAFNIQKLTVDLGDGNDSFDLNECTIGKFVFKGGKGNDQAFFSNSSIASLNVNMGDGDDLVNCGLDGVISVSGKTTFNGGNGTEDTLIYTNAMFTTPPKIKGFETSPA